MSVAQGQNGTRERHRIAPGRNEGRRAVFSKLPGAVLRAALVVILITLPSTFIPHASADGTLVTLLIAISAATFIFVEYAAISPSFVEFRSAPPLNRLRFGALFLCVLMLSLIAQVGPDSPAISKLFYLLAANAGHMMDMPYSPVRNLLMLLPDSASARSVEVVRTYAGLAYLLSIVSVSIFIILLRMRRWPKRRESFNVWVNLPRFDPTASGDVVARLNRDSTINAILGFLLPFLIPAVLKFVSLFTGPFMFSDPLTMIWMVTIWAFLPASLLMRGVALNRVAGLIYKERKRAYKRAVEDGMLPA